MNKELQILLEALPHEARPGAEQLWAKMPSDVRQELELTLGGFSKLLKQNPGSVNDLFKLLSRTTSPVLSEMSKVAVVGPVNVGKSTLYNALITRPEDRAKASPVPGTTKENKTSAVGLFNLIDTPGADNAAEGAGVKEKETAFEAAHDADFLIIVFDAAGSVTASDRALYRELSALGKPHIVALNKIDLVKKADRRLVIEAAARNLDLTVDSIIPVSAQSSQGVDQLVLEMTAAEPQLLSKVGEVMPSLRRKLAWQATRRAAIASALIALTPIPVIDLVPLTVIQGGLVLTISRIYGEQLGIRRLAELIPSFGVGWIARTLFQEISKVAGLPGWVLSASIAASATMAIGYSVMSWFETGVKPTKAQMQEFAKKSQGLVGEMLKNVGADDPDKKRVTDELEGKLPDDFDSLLETEAKAAQAVEAAKAAAEGATAEGVAVEQLAEGASEQTS
jgi:small GTP-binding protein